MYNMPQPPDNSSGFITTSPPKRKRWPLIVGGSVVGVLALVVGSAVIVGQSDDPTPRTVAAAPTASTAVYYGSCGDAEKAGVYAIREGEPGYRRGLDLDGDGVACDIAAPSPLPAAYTPTVKDFKLRVKILRKKCFGSAGCNITYRIQVEYLGDQLPDPSKTYEIGYEVKGAEDPIINTLEITGDQSSVDSEETTGTSSSSAKLTAKVTSVDEI